MNFSGALSFSGGIILFLILGLIISLTTRGILTLFPSRHPGMTGFLVALLFLLLFPLIRLLAPLAVLLPLPHDLFLLQFYNYLLPILPCILLARVLTILARRGRLSHYLVVFSYILILSLLMSRSGWRLLLPLDKLMTGYGVLFLFLIFQILLVMTAGEKGRFITVFPTLVLLLLIPLLSLMLLNRNYRNESLKEGGGLLESSLFRFDFSDFLSLESSISMKDDLVFMMKKEGLGDDFMIRRFVLSDYSVEKGFFRVPGGTLEVPGRLQPEYLVGEQPETWDSPDFLLTERMVQEYFLVNFDSSAFLGLNSPVSMTPYQSWEQSSFSRMYKVESMVSQSWGWDLLEAKTLEGSSGQEKEFLEYYTNYGAQGDIKEFAERLVEGKEDYYDRVIAIEEYLQLNFFYSLHPGESVEGDQLRYFLFETRKGYCSYFAFSMALLCRSVGIPARVALGFWVDGSSGVLNYYPVKANQAHAWVEVYFPEYGWIEFDPTSQIPAPGEEFQFVPFSTQEMEPYLKEILDNRDHLKAVEASETNLEERRKRFWWNQKGSRPVLFGIKLLCLLSVFLLLLRIFNRIRTLLIPLDSRKKASFFFHLHMILAESQLRRRKRGESFQDFASSFEAGSNPGLKEFIGLYEKIRFGRSSLEDLKTLSHLGAGFRKSLSVRAGGLRKIRYFLVLFLKGASREK
jgi:transglutaminase-like putative cysteine protease